jgi:hypothetical protein
MPKPTRAEDLKRGTAIQFGLLDEWIYLRSVTLEFERIVIQGFVHPDRADDRGYVVMSVPPGFIFLAKSKPSQE